MFGGLRVWGGLARAERGGLAWVSSEESPGVEHGFGEILAWWVWREPETSVGKKRAFTKQKTVSFQKERRTHLIWWARSCCVLM